MGGISPGVAISSKINGGARCDSNRGTSSGDAASTCLEPRRHGSQMTAFYTALPRARGNPLPWRRIFPHRSAYFNSMASHAVYQLSVR